MAIRSTSLETKPVRGVVGVNHCEWLVPKGLAVLTFIPRQVICHRQ
jgi:hypothetical protein